MLGTRQQNFIECLVFVPVSTSRGFPPELSITSEKQESLMPRDEMTIADVLKDPLIRQMMRADRVSLRELKKLLLDARSMRAGSGSPGRTAAGPAFLQAT